MWMINKILFLQEQALLLPEIIVKVKADGSYDYESATPVVIGENGAKSIYTDERVMQYPLQFLMELMWYLKQKHLTTWKQSKLLR